MPEETQEILFSEAAVDRSALRPVEESGGLNLDQNGGVRNRGKGHQSECGGGKKKGGGGGAK